jgi:hypothetical protein
VLALSRTKIRVLRARLLRVARRKFRAEWRRAEASRCLDKKDAAHSPKSKTALHPHRALVVDLLFASDGPSAERDVELICALRDLALFRPACQRKLKSKTRRERFVVAPQPAIQYSPTLQLTNSPIYAFNNGLLLPAQSAHENKKPRCESGHGQKRDFIADENDGTKEGDANPAKRYRRDESTGRHPCCETNCIRHLKPFRTRLDMEAHWRKKHDLNLVAPVLFPIFNCPESNCVHYRREFGGRMELFRHWKATHCFTGAATEAPQDFKRLASKLG